MPIKEIWNEMPWKITVKLNAASTIDFNVTFVLFKRNTFHHRWSILNMITYTIEFFYSNKHCNTCFVKLFSFGDKNRYLFTVSL